MEPFEIELKNALTRTDPLPAAQLAALNDRIVQTFTRKQQAFRRLTLAYLAAMTVAILALLALYMSTSDLKQCLLLGIGILIAFEGTVLMKLWFWIMHSKITTMREIKMLQLAVAELKTRPSPESRGTAPAFPDEDASAPAPTPTAPASSKLLQVIIAAVWLLAGASFVYLVWLQNPWEPHDVTPYFEKTIAAGDVLAEKEWQENFEVAKPHKRFYVQVLAQGMATRIWLACNAEGHEPMFTGQVEAGSRFYFGTPTQGRYTVKAKAEEAARGYALRIGGVDELPNLSPLHLFLLMISASVTVAIPLARLQDRWLRRIDPELER